MTSIGARPRFRLPLKSALRLARLQPLPRALLWQPSPPASGDPAIARRLAAGVFLFEGSLVEAQVRTPWDIVSPNLAWSRALHGHDWLDHAAVSDDTAIRSLLIDWIWSWLARYDNGDGPGWTPELIARRLTRWIAHSSLLLRGQSSENSARFFTALGLQARLLSWRWQDTVRAVDRIESLAGLVYANLSLEGGRQDVFRSITLLGQEAERLIGERGEISSRNPEDLARIVMLLTWSARAIGDAELDLAPGHMKSTQRAATMVRALSHASGSLARFHGGRDGQELPLNDIRSIAAAQSRVTAASDMMGYARLSCGTSVLIADGKAAPTNSDRAHVSALAFEFSSGGHEILANAGPGTGFGEAAAASSHLMTAHSGVHLGPGRLGPSGSGTGSRKSPKEGDITARVEMNKEGAWFLGDTTLYEKNYGLKVERRIHLSADGRRLAGEDTALATRAETRARVLQAFPNPDALCEMHVIFHLHPDVSADYAMNGQAILIKLRKGLSWLLRADAEHLTVTPSAYYDAARPKPRPATAIVARTTVLEYWGRITWSIEQLPDGASPLPTVERTG